MNAIVLRLFLCGIAFPCLNHAADPQAELTEMERRKAHLQDRAQYEWVRLQNLRFSSTRENEYFARDRFEVVLGGNCSITLVKVKQGIYTEGLTQEQVDALVGIPNRGNDGNTWRFMFPVNVKRTVEIPYDFFIMESLATNSMFRAFVQETGYRTSVSRYGTGWVVDSQPKWRQGIGNDWEVPPSGRALPDHPVVQVSWFDVMAFAHWLSEKTGIVFRPPTKDEWLFAAYPPSLNGQQVCFTWGNDINEAPKRANFGTRELTDYSWIHEQFSDGHRLTSPVKAYPPNERELYDMSGNIWSWCFQRQLYEAGRRAGDD